MTKPKPPPRLPNLKTARQLVQDAWLNPTEQGLVEVRQALVRRMWQARKVQRWQPAKDQPSLSASMLAQAQTTRANLHALYLQVCEQQAGRDWEINDAERRARYRHRHNRQQYEREALQRHKGSTAMLSLNIPASPQDHAYQPAPTTSAPIIIHQSTGSTESAPVLTAKYRHRRKEMLHQFAVHHLARVLYCAHYSGWGSLNLTPSYGPPSASPRPPTKGAVAFSGTLTYQNVVFMVDTFITSTEYQRAFDRLPLAHQDEIRSYYRRNPAKNDIAPEIANWTYSRTTEAFDALLDRLFEQGSLT